jgi:hypothetical protein
LKLGEYRLESGDFTSLTQIPGFNSLVVLHDTESGLGTAIDRVENELFQ